MANASTFPRAVKSQYRIHSGGGGGGGGYQEGEECGVAESSATKEYFRVHPGTSGSWRTTNQRSGPSSAAEESRIQRQNSS